MKKGKLTYLLIASVVGVWGVIFYRIYVSIDSDTEPFSISSAGPKAQYFSLVNHDNDNVALVLNYPDPFSEIALGKEEPNQQTLPGDINIPAAVIPPKQPVDWAGIKYTGFIRNASTKEKVAIIQVAGMDAMLVEGQTMHGVKLLKHEGDSIKIQYQKSTKYISIQ